MRLGDRMRFTTQLLGYDEKRLHYIHHMYHAEEGFLAAANEILAVHVGMASRRSSPIPAPAVEALRDLGAAQAHLPMPPEAGRAIGLSRKPAAAMPAER
jgi:acyl-CoA thioester hydrolase